MLLSTYALLTLTVEQECERTVIQSLQDCLADPIKDGSFHCAAIAKRAEQLIALAESRHQCRLEDILFPELRNASPTLDELLRKIEYLGRIGREMLPALRAGLRPESTFGQQQSVRACALVGAYCHNVSERLACEEFVLLPLAQRVLPTEAWFRVGTEFLMQDDLRAIPHSR